MPKFFCLHRSPDPPRKLGRQKHLRAFRRCGHGLHCRQFLAGNVVAGLEDVICQSDGCAARSYCGGRRNQQPVRQGDPVDDDFFITMQGRETYKHAVRNMVHICEDVLTRNGLTAKDVNLLVPHQANMRIITAVGSRLDMTGDRVFVNVDKYGNTSSASIPLAITEARAAGRIKAGDRMLVTAFGAGLTGRGPAAVLIFSGLSALRPPTCNHFAARILHGRRGTESHSIKRCRAGQSAGRRAFFLSAALK